MIVTGFFVMAAIVRLIFQEEELVLEEILFLEDDLVLEEEHLPTSQEESSPGGPDELVV